ncbi:hypothetical protein HRbin02_01306 [Candidatus Calditenuaceae archaeon HR02]|nr:hypothetical protein HRbin02_01306 [Candidatus Calditenuaceae archaeon HR02]
MAGKGRIVQRRKIVVDKKALVLARQAARRQPRITFYSPLSSLVLNYLKNVTPRFSISDEVSRIVESELARRYPELVSAARRSLRLS